MKQLFAKSLALTAIAFISSQAFSAVKDQESIGIMSTANDAEVAAAQVAKKQGAMKEVKDFAQHMIDEHTKNKAEGMKIAQKDKLSPQTSADAKTLAQDSSMKLESMKKLSGAAFDKAYMDNQVMMHQQLLSKLDTELIPSATAPEWRTFLETTKSHVQEHLTQAQKIQSMIK